MEIGSKALMTCPASMAYGDVMKPGIPENSDLEFDVELLACAKDEADGLDLDAMKAIAVEADVDNGSMDDKTTLPA